MSSVTHFGETEWSTTGSSITLSELGIVSAMSKYMLAHDEYTIEEAQEWAEAEMGEAHSDQGHLIATACSVSCSGPFHAVSITYKGVPDDVERNAIKISASVSQEPIESHPDFRTKLAGSRGAEINSAVFNDDGTFLAFKVDPECPRLPGQNKQGVKSYLEPAMTYEVKTTYGADTGKDTSGGAMKALENVGKRYKRDDLPGHKVAGEGTEYKMEAGRERDWLLVGADFSSIGYDAKVISLKYRMSGRRKWNEEIYEEGD